MSALAAKVPFDVALLKSTLGRFEWCGDIDDATPISARFLAAIEIAGVPLHLEGVQVTLNDRKEQVAAYESWEEWLSDLYGFSHPGGRYMTLDIDGRDYVVTAYPFTA